MELSERSHRLQVELDNVSASLEESEAKGVRTGGEGETKEVKKLSSKLQHLCCRRRSI